MTYNSAPILVFFVQFIYLVLKCFFGSDEEEEEDPDNQLVEGLADYYEALKRDDKNIVMGQEEYYKSNFLLKTYSDEQYGKMKNADVADQEKIIMGCATYRLLDSLLYVQAFQYEPPKLQDDGSTVRDGVIVICTDDREDIPQEAKENDLK